MADYKLTINATEFVLLRKQLEAENERINHALWRNSKTTGSATHPSLQRERNKLEQELQTVEGLERKLRSLVGSPTAFTA